MEALWRLLPGRGSPGFEVWGGGGWRSAGRAVSKARPRPRSAAPSLPIAAAAQLESSLGGRSGAGRHRQAQPAVRYPATRSLPAAREWKTPTTRRPSRPRPPASIPAAAGAITVASIQPKSRARAAWPHRVAPGRGGACVQPASRGDLCGQLRSGVRGFGGLGGPGPGQRCAARRRTPRPSSARRQPSPAPSAPSRAAR